MNLSVVACSVIYLNFGTPKTNSFFIWDIWKIYAFKVSQYLSLLQYMMVNSVDLIVACSVLTQFPQAR